MRKFILTLSTTFSLLSVSQPIFIKFGTFLTTSSLMLIASKKVNAQHSTSDWQSGLKKFNNSDFSGAIEDFSEAIKKEAIDKYYFYRGLSFSNIGKFREAIIDLTTMIDMNSDRKLWGYYNRGMAYYSINQKNNALNDFDEANRLYKQAKSKDYLNALWMSAIIRIEKGAYLVGCWDAEKAIKLGQKDAIRWGKEIIKYKNDVCDIKGDMQKDATLRKMLN